MFDEVVKESFSLQEEKILSMWEEKDIFQKSLEIRKDGEKFSFYDGPPFATGLPHYGHLLAGTIKDVVPRFKTMKGYYVSRRFGWDCHGLPVENEIEKEQGLSGADAIEKFGIAEFNEACRAIVLRYSNEWKKTVSRMGRWVDFDQTYRTMDRTFMESVWWVFKQLFDKGLVYEGYKVMPFSTKLGTPLSNFEATQNYKEVDDPALTVMFPVLGKDKTFLLAWTTTPWTLISNLAATVGADIDYVLVKQEETGKRFVLAKDRLGDYEAILGSHEIEQNLKGSELVGWEYEPPFSFFESKRSEGAFKVISGDFVSTEDGTGIVHTAPAFGEDDFYACKEAGVPLACPVDGNGRFTDLVPDYAGQYVKDADKDIIRSLKNRSRIFKHATIKHRYPFCWRSDTPLIYRVVESWFVAVEKIKDQLLESNSQIHWTPSHIKEGRFGRWLEGARDWAISRNRYWGTPIPLWRSDDGDLIAIGSTQELEELVGEKVDDLHRHFIDDLSFVKDGKIYRRISQVFDCWFESGSMPYAQNHYPFENADSFEQQFPADFIAEGLDQTRGWFYTLTVLSTALFGKPAFKNVIVNGIILAEDGAKMSKRLKNYPDPQKMIDQYGADAIRLCMLHSPAVKGDDLSFSESKVALTMRQVLIPLWNAYSFFVTYARICKWTPEQKPSEEAPVLDAWMLSCVQRLVQKVEAGMEEYDLSRSVEPFVDFVDELTNWYIRRSRRRFWSEEDSSDRRHAFQTLYQALLALSKVTAPFIPFFSENIYQNLRTESDPESVHLCDFPEADLNVRQESLEQAMAALQQVVSLGHSLRKEHKMRVRQPLQTVHIACINEKVLDFLSSQKHLIQEELNLKAVELTANDAEFVHFTIKPNFRTLGKKVGKLMRGAQKEIAGLSQEDMQSLMDGQPVTIHVEGESICLEKEDVEVHREVREGLVAAHEKDLTVVLDIQLNDALLVEGMAREIVHRVNHIRKDSGLEITDRIELSIHSKATVVNDAVEQFKDFISQEVLAVSFVSDGSKGESYDLNGEQAIIHVQQVVS